MQSALEAGRKELAGLDRNDSAVRKLQALEARLGKTASAMDQAQKRTVELRNRIRDLAAPSQRMQREFETARRKSSALYRSQLKQGDELRRLRDELRGAGIDTWSLDDARRRIASDIERAAGKMDRLCEASARVVESQERMERRMDQTAKLSLVGSGMDRFTQGILGPAARSVEAVRQVERSKGGLRSLGLTRQEADLIAGRGRAVGGVTHRPPAEIPTGWTFAAGTRVISVRVRHPLLPRGRVGADGGKNRLQRAAATVLVDKAQCEAQIPRADRAAWRRGVVDRYRTGSGRRDSIPLGPRLGSTPNLVWNTAGWAITGLRAFPRSPPGSTPGPLADTRA